MRLLLLRALRALGSRRALDHGTLRMVGAAASTVGDINQTGEGQTWLWVTVGKALQPFFRLIGGKHKVWPPSKQSAPLIILGWLLLTSPLLFLMRERRNLSVEEVVDRRREYALSSLENMIQNERVRLENEEKKKKEKEENDVKKKKAAASGEKVEGADEEGEEEVGEEDATKIPV